MKKYLAISALISTLMITSIAGGSPIANAPIREPVPVTCTYQGFVPFSSKVWNLILWERERPTPVIVNALKRRLSCAPLGHRKEMKKRWRRDKKEFYEHRGEMLFRINVTPYRCGSSWWATSCDVPLHESGYGSGGGNLYGLLDAWYVHGCTEFAPDAWSATKRQQDICASRHWATYGRGGWPSY